MLVRSAQRPSLQPANAPLLRRMMLRYFGNRRAAPSRSCSPSRGCERYVTSREASGTEIMGRSKAQLRKLGEVKAVLQHLQRMAADPASLGQQSADKAMAHAAHSFMRRKAVLALLGGGVLTSIL